MTWLVVSIVLLTFASSGHSQAAEKKTVRSKSITQKKEWRVIDGFRSAKFGMNEKQVIRAIAKDFKISNKKVERLMVSSVKTKVLIIHTSKLIELGGPADIVYVLGYKSKKLIGINIDWGKGVSDNFDPNDLVSACNVLTKYFAKKRYKDEGYAVNLKISDTEIIAFRGQDKKGRGIYLVLKTPKMGKETNKKRDRKNMSLVLHYFDDVKKRDVYEVKNKP